VLTLARPRRRRVQARQTTAPAACMEMRSRRTRKS